MFCDVKVTFDLWPPNANSGHPWVQKDLCEDIPSSCTDNSVQLPEWRHIMARLEYRSGLNVLKDEEWSLNMALQISTVWMQMLEPISED